MQPSVAPEPPHARARAVHWLATGVGVAAVVVGMALAQPPGALATSQGAASTGPDPGTVGYPVRCPGVPVDVVSRVHADLDADGRPDTVAVVRCHAETGTPPSGVYVLSSGGTGRRPRIVATLVDPRQRLSLTGFAVAGRTVSATLLGYSSDRVPRCCPDLSRRYSWVWSEGRFVARAGPHAGSV